MSRIDNEIRARVESFVDDLTELIRQSALESVQEALTGEGQPAPRPPRRAAAAPRRKARGGKRIRRTAADIQAVKADLTAHVKTHPGQRLGEIAKALGLETKEARGPAFALVESGALKTTGQRGGTRYFVRGAATSTPAKAGARKAKKKAAKRKTKKKTTKRKPK